MADEVFGSGNFVSQIAFQTTSGAGSPGELRTIPSTVNYLIWYAKSRGAYKYRPLFIDKSQGRSIATNYVWLELSTELVGA